LGPGFRYRTLDIQQAGSREIAVNLDRLLARGHHLDLVASLIEGDLGKEVLLLLKRVSDQSGNLRASVGHGVVSRVCASTRTVKGSDGRRPKEIRRKRQAPSAAPPPADDSGRCASSSAPAGHPFVACKNVLAAFSAGRSPSACTVWATRGA